MLWLAPGMRAVEPLPEPFVTDSLGLLAQLGVFPVVSLALYAVGAFLLSPRLDRTLERGGVGPTVRAGMTGFGNVFLLLAAGFARPRPSS